VGANKTFISPLAPTDRTIVKVAYRDYSTGKLEDSYGVLRDSFTSLSPTSPDQAYIANYRVEIIPATPRLRDEFCTAIEVWPTTGANKSVTQAITGTNFVGGRIGNVIGVQATSLGAGTIVLPSPGTYKLFVGGMGLAATRTFVGGGNISSLQTVTGGLNCTGGCKATSQGTLYLNVVVSAAGTGSANTISIGASSGGGLVAPDAPTAVRIIR
jgi:hypothetical protein